MRAGWGHKREGDSTVEREVGRESNQRNKRLRQQRTGDANKHRNEGDDYRTAVNDLVFFRCANGRDGMLLGPLDRGGEFRRKRKDSLLAGAVSEVSAQWR